MEEINDQRWRVASIGGGELSEVEVSNQSLGGGVDLSEVGGSNQRWRGAIKVGGNLQ